MSPHCSNTHDLWLHSIHVSMSTMCSCLISATALSVLSLLWALVKPCRPVNNVPCTSTPSCALQSRKGAWACNPISTCHMSQASQGAHALTTARCTSSTPDWSSGCRHGTCSSAYFRHCARTLSTQGQRSLPASLPLL